MSAADHKHARSVARRCVENAKAMLGNGWQHVSHDVRWALVCAEIVGVLHIQDESVSDAAFRAYFESLRAEAVGLVGP